MLKFFASDVLFIPGESSPLIAIMYETTPYGFSAFPVYYPAAAVKIAISF